MSFLDSLFGGGGVAYDTNAAKQDFLWRQNQARYNTNSAGGSVTWNPQTNTQQVNYTPQMQGLLNSLFSGDAAAKRAENSIFNNFQNRYEPIFQRQNNNLQDRLVNQGIPVGSAAYSQAMQDLSQNQNDARNQAYNQAVLTGQQVAQQNQQQNLATFNALNPQNGYSAGAGTPNVDMYGNSVTQANANAQNKFGNMMQLTGMLFSDARIKENIRPVGQLFNGLTVYTFNFPGDETTRLGLLAQEVEELIPQAVSESPEGLKMLDYLLATQYEGEEKQQEENYAE